MKYRHSYHAGNFADAMKHLVLIEMLNALLRKPGEFVYIETHSGRGEYSLDGRETRSTAEYRDGIGRLLESRELLQGPIRDYVELVLRLGGDPNSGRLQRYPGSPLLATHLIRSTDRAVLVELEPTERRALARSVSAHPNASVLGEDGYRALRGLLPPAERRGMVLIDPSYEEEKEFERVQEALLDSHRRWATGIFAIWYPIKRRAAITQFHAQLARSGLRRILCAELNLYPQDSQVALNGSGMIVVNPPWKLDESLRQLLPDMWRSFGAHKGGGIRCDWLVPE
ncbi:MAG TPA: 23S rRNA (adenine(2030)-N(6))-methyltransferase RlmJ [Steroidobacteraceae bacterium]|nr:23S rRNA (adenine(2030)-N(6))-methyltransferase RlmJ [Steroidobacteraceae bacterium]